MSSHGSKCSSYVGISQSDEIIITILSYYTLLIVFRQFHLKLCHHKLSYIHINYVKMTRGASFMNVSNSFLIWCYFSTPLILRVS